jgi:Zn-dependent protease with chaperone function
LGDILVFSMPIAMLSQLRLSRARKFSLIGIFATGALYVPMTQLPWLRKKERQADTHAAFIAG